MERKKRDLLTTPLNVMMLLFLVFCSPLVVWSQSRIDEANELAKQAHELGKQGDSEAAIAMYRSALTKAPELHGARFLLGRLLAGLSRFEEARVEFATLVEANPQDAAARRGEATALLLLGRWRDARTKLQEGVSTIPQDGQLAHLLARVLASAPDEENRNGHHAIQIAMAVYKIKTIPLVGETVAMGFAEIGDFAEAAKIQQALINDVEQHSEEYGQSMDLTLMKERLDAYSRNQAWRAKSALEIVSSTELPTAKSD